MLIFRNIQIIQVFLVTGGVFGSFNQLSSTETLKSGDGSWTDVGNLPVPMFGLRGVSFQNQIIVTGKKL